MNGILFLVMPLLRGMSLEKHLQQRRSWKMAEILRIGREVASGLAAAHQRGAIHRDVKPANLWLDVNGNVKLLDFGLARLLSDDTGLTQSGIIAGTPSYMAPEQARGDTSDARTDLFSLGCVLYQLCTGEAPFKRDSVYSTLTALATEDPIPVDRVNPDISQPLADMIMRLIAKQAANRPGSAALVEDCLKALEQSLARRGAAGDQPDRHGATDESNTANYPMDSLSANATGRKAGRRIWIYWAFAVALVLLLGGMYFLQFFTFFVDTGEEPRQTKGSWKTLAPMPTSRPYITAGVIVGKLHVVGLGTNHEVYDPVTNEWRNAAPELFSRSLAASGVFKNRFFVAGGWLDSDSNRPTAALHVFNPVTNSWKAGVSMLKARGNAASAMVGGKLYVAGGTTKIYLPSSNQLQIFDPKANSWSWGSPMPTAREGAAAAGIGGKLYVVGGLERLENDPNNFIDSTALEIYDPATNKWISGAPMPTGRDGLMVGVVNGKLYAVGGQSNQSKKLYNLVEVYDPVANTWTAETPMPAPQIFGAGVVIDNKLFVVGGHTTGSVHSKSLILFFPGLAG